MKVLLNQFQRGFPKPTHLMSHWNGSAWKYKLLLLGIFSIQSFFLSAQWVTYIDCECNMNPYITLTESFGTTVDRILCSGETATIKAFGGFKYKWSTGDTTNTITVSKGGGYGVTISDITGCVAVENILITEYSKPLLVYNDPICKGSQNSIRVNGDDLTYLWDTGSTDSYLNVSTGGTYSVTVTDTYGCIHKQSVTLGERPSPPIYIDVIDQSGTYNDHHVCWGDKVKLQATEGFIRYNWSPTKGLSTPKSASTIVKPTETTTYTIVATDAGGCTVMEQVKIIVTPMFTTISPNTNICQGSSTQLVASGGTNYSWSPTTGLSDSRIANPSASPTETTTYTVEITDSYGCSDVKQVTVEMDDSHTTISSNTSICRGSSTQLVASGGISYTWSPSTGLSSPTIANPTASPTVPTTYSVMIATANGCTKVEQVTVGVEDIITKVSPNTSICKGSSTQLIANGGSSYSWSPTTGLNNATIGNPIASPTVSTTYTVVITNTLGCTKVEQVEVGVQDIHTTISPNTNICTGTSTQLIASGGITYNWSPTVGLSNPTIANPIASPSATTDYQVVITNSHGCQNVEHVTVGVYELSTTISPTTNICIGSSTQLVASGGTTYRWSPTTGLSNPTIANPVASPSSTTNYQVIITYANGCEKVEHVTIGVFDDTIPDIDNVNICNGSSTQLVASGGSQYSWSPADGLSSTTISNPIASPTQTTIYTVEVTTPNGCIVTKQVTVGIYETNIPNIADISICRGTSTPIIASGGVEYSWSPADGLSSTVIANPEASPDTTTTYTVIITDANGCSDTKTVTVNVIETPTEVGTTERICAGESITLSGAPVGISYVWTPTTNLNDNTAASPVAFPAITTTYTASVTDSTGCGRVFTKTIEVVSVSVDIIGDTTLCLGDSTSLTGVPSSNFAGSTYTYLWSTGSTNSFISVASSATTYMVTITDEQGCTAVDSITVSGNDIQVDAGSDQLICLGTTAQLASEVSINGVVVPDGNLTFDWSPTTNIDDPTIANPMVSPAITTTYTVIVTDENGCVAVDSVVVAVNTYEVEAGPDRVNCLGGNITLTPTYTLNGAVISALDTTITYSWSPAATIVDSTVANPVVAPTTATLYTVQIMDANGCVAEDSVFVAVNDLQVETTGDTLICPDISILLSSVLTLNGNETGSGSSFTYSWSPTTRIDPLTNQEKSLIDDPTVSNPMVFPDVSTTYVLTVTDTNGCTATDSVFIEVYPKILLAAMVSPANPDSGQIATLNVFILDGPDNPDYCYAWTGPLPVADSTLSTTTFIPTARDSVFTFLVDVTEKNTGCQERAVASAITPMAAISGTVFTENGSKIEEGKVHLIGSEEFPFTTNQSGNFRFENIPMYESYTIKPEKDQDPLNGVTTADLVAISKHILGVQKLNSPYKIIAADVNNSKTVTIFDIVELRKLILGNALYFSNNFSWRFVDATYQFAKPTQPLQENFPEVYRIEDLESNMEQLNFIAVKVGDVNNSVVTNPLTKTESRSSQGVFQWTVQPTLDITEETITYHFYPKDFESIEGYQFSIDFNEQEMSFENLIPSDLVADNHFGWNALARGIITTSWHDLTKSEWDSETSLFSLVFKKKDRSKQSPQLRISSVIPAEAYNNTGELLEVALVQQPTIETITRDQLILHQNEPNPFTGQTVIGFHLPKAARASIRIFNATGKEIKVYNEFYRKGYNSILLRSKELSAYGALYYQLSTAEQVITKKMIHLK